MKKGYRYTESGLTNVWLANGYPIRKTKYGEGVIARRTLPAAVVEN